MANTPIEIPDTMARGMWSPPNGATPQMLPIFGKIIPDGELRTDLPDKTDDELVALGWKKVDEPSYATLGANFSRIIMNGIVKQENMMKHLLLKSKNFLQPDTMVFGLIC